uniref:thiol oxidase n=1 Tax=viral metagenome TaxID=1070528 RepID=A0A6C0B5B5_9ZZZZ
MTIKWGPIYWNYIHMITLHYPIKPSKKEKDLYFNLIWNFINTLPCPTCKKEVTKLITNNNLQKSLESRETVVKYFWSIHNQVNIRLKKHPLSFRNFKNLYKSGTSFNLFSVRKSNKIKNIIIIVLVIIILFLGLKVYKG